MAGMIASLEASLADNALLNHFAVLTLPTYVSCHYFFSACRLNLDGLMLKKLARQFFVGLKYNYFADLARYTLVERIFHKSECRIVLAEFFQYLSLFEFVSH